MVWALRTFGEVDGGRNHGETEGGPDRDAHYPGTAD
jgi:hypothetical protein